MTHRISMFAAGALFALSMFFVFRPPQHAEGLQRPYPRLVGEACISHSEPLLTPVEYTCETP
jgi:hypothetical protein